MIMFQKVAIIGLGMIGASIISAMRDRGLCHHVIAADHNLDGLDFAKRIGLIDEIGASVADVCRDDVDLYIIAAPTKATTQIINELAHAKMAGLIADDAIITDVASTKGSIYKAVLEACENVGQPTDFLSLVLSHPIAGAENSGVTARNAKLFVGRQFIICDDNPPTAQNCFIQKIKALWEAIGANVIIMTSQRHDEILAYTSHLPHLLSFNLTHQLASHDDNLDIFRYAAGGFKDFSRISASSPIMWHDIFMDNKDALLKSLDDYEKNLQDFRKLIEQGDSETLIAWLTAARHARRHFGHMLAQSQISQAGQNKHNDSTIQENDMTSQAYHIRPSRHINGTITVAGDKSISHRSIMLGSLADGVTHVSGFLEGEDALATLQAFKDMGVKIERDGDKVTIHGVGMDGLSAPQDALYMGNSGTSMRLLAGILSAQAFDSVMTGDVSLSKRPMERVATPLRSMGAAIQTTGEKGTAPISITGGQKLSAIDYTLPVASAQIKSCLILASLWANGTTTITEPEVSRDHTERMLKAFGYPIKKDGNSISITGGGRLTATDIVVPADISSAAFFMVLGAIGGGNGLTIRKVGMNPTRTGVIDILRLMGADITVSNETVVGGEPIADITVKPSALKGIDIPEYLVPLAIDEFPVLFVAASCAIGTTKLTGAKELRVKESDRIQVMADGLSALGIDCTVLDDGIIIQGKGEPMTGGERNTVFGGGEIQSHHDHRIAMSFSVASVRASDDIIIQGTETVATSFPNFAELANEVGLNIAVS